MDDFQKFFHKFLLKIIPRFSKKIVCGLFKKLPRILSEIFPRFYLEIPLDVPPKISPKKFPAISSGNKKILQIFLQWFFFGESFKDFLWNSSQVPSNRVSLRIFFKVFSRSAYRNSFRKSYRDCFRNSFGFLNEILQGFLQKIIHGFLSKSISMEQEIILWICCCCLP